MISAVRRCHRVRNTNHCLQPKKKHYRYLLLRNFLIVAVTHRLNLRHILITLQFISTIARDTSRQLLHNTGKALKQFKPYTTTEKQLNIPSKTTIKNKTSYFRTETNESSSKTAQKHWRYTRLKFSTAAILKFHGQLTPKTSNAHNVGVFCSISTVFSPKRPESYPPHFHPIRPCV